MNWEIVFLVFYILLIVNTENDIMQQKSECIACLQIKYSLIYTVLSVATRKCIAPWAHQKIQKI